MQSVHSGLAAGVEHLHSVAVAALTRLIEQETDPATLRSLISIAARFKAPKPAPDPEATHLGPRQRERTVRQEADLTRDGSQGASPAGCLPAPLAATGEGALGPSTAGRSSTTVSTPAASSTPSTASPQPPAKKRIIYIPGISTRETLNAWTKQCEEDKAEAAAASLAMPALKSPPALTP